MPSLLPVLVHDLDLPPALRADLEAYRAAPSPEARTAARRRAAMGLLGAFDLDAIEVASLLKLDAKLDSQPAARPRFPSPFQAVPASC
jgi:hypothetical protein